MSYYITQAGREFIEEAAPKVPERGGGMRTTVLQSGAPATRPGTHRRPTASSWWRPKFAHRLQQVLRRHAQREPLQTPKVIIPGANQAGWGSTGQGSRQRLGMGEGKLGRNLAMAAALSVPVGGLLASRHIASKLGTPPTTEEPADTAGEARRVPGRAGKATTATTKRGIRGKAPRTGSSVSDT